jgi:putative flippase GtrA
MPYRELIRNQIVRFFVVGGINTLFGYSCFTLLLFLGLHYAIASLFATIFGVLFNFKTTGTLVFRSRNNCLIFRFFASYAVIYLINIASLKVFSFMDISPYIGGLVLILPMAVFGFILNKRFVFIYG